MTQKTGYEGVPTSTAAPSSPSDMRYEGKWELGFGLAGVFIAAVIGFTHGPAVASAIATPSLLLTGMGMADIRNGRAGFRPDPVDEPQQSSTPPQQTLQP